MGLLAPIALMAAFGYGYRLWTRWRSQRGSCSRSAAALRQLLRAGGGIVDRRRDTSRGVAAHGSASRRRWSRCCWRCRANGGTASAADRLAVIRGWHCSGSSGRLPASVVSRIESVTDEIVAFSDVRGVDITPENYANVERLAHWQAALNMAQANPWLGVGFGNYEIAYPHYNLLNWQLALGHAHNYYLNVFAEAGMIGLVGYLALWVSVMVMTWRARRHPDPLARLIVVGLFGTWTYLAVHSLTDNLYVNNLFLHLGVMLGVLAVLHRCSMREDGMSQTSTIKRVAVRNPLDGPIYAIANRFGGSKAKEVERFLKFAVVGTVGAVIDSGTLFLLQATVLPPTLKDPDWNVAIAQTIAFIMAILSNYIWNRHLDVPRFALALVA